MRHSRTFFTTFLQVKNRNVISQILFIFHSVLPECNSPEIEKKRLQNLMEPIVHIPQYIFTFFSERHHLPWHQTGEHPFGRRRPHSPHGFWTKSRISTRWHCAKGNFFLRHYWIHGTWGEFASFDCLQVLFTI